MTANKQATQKKAKQSTGKLALIRVRGSVHQRGDVKRTLKLLNLNRVNHCVVVDDSPQYRGMIQKVNNYVTWGEVDKETMNKLLLKRGRIPGNTRIDEKFIKDNSSAGSVDKFIEKFFDKEEDLKSLGIKPVFRLRPPRKGYDRAGIKKPYSLGGALGYRGEKINELLDRMI